MANLVVKTNQLNVALQNLTLPEIRIIQLGIVEARETGKGLSSDQPLRIDGMKYAEVFGTSRQNAYMLLKKSEDTLFNRRFSFIDDDGHLVKSRWISQVKYLNDEGTIEIVFTPAVVKGISRIDGLEQFFTSYLLEQTSTMQSHYSVRLYELLIQWKNTKKTPVFALEKFRSQLGLGFDEYKAMNDFKKRVLHVAVDEINEKSDLKISYEQTKKGRKIIGFQFKVLQKEKVKKVTDPQRDPENGDMFTIDGLSDKQLKRIARHKGFISTYGSLAKGDAGRDWNTFTNLMIDLIKKDPARFNKKKPIREYLEGSDEDYEYGF